MTIKLFKIKMIWKKIKKIKETKFRRKICKTWFLKVKISKNNKILY